MPVFPKLVCILTSLGRPLISQNPGHPKQTPFSGGWDPGIPTLEASKDSSIAGKMGARHMPGIPCLGALHGRPSHSSLSTEWIPLLFVKDPIQMLIFEPSLMLPNPTQVTRSINPFSVFTKHFIHDSASVLLLIYVSLLHMYDCTDVTAFTHYI